MMARELWPLLLPWEFQRMFQTPAFSLAVVAIYELNWHWEEQEFSNTPFQINE